MAVNKKEKKNKTLTNWFRVCRWACGCAEADDCKERKKEKKRKRNDSLVFRAGRWVCGHVVDGRAWMCLRADMNGCKQKNREEEKEKRKRKDSSQVVGMNVQFEFEHCSNAWKGCITCPNTV